MIHLAIILASSFFKNSRGLSPFGRIVITPCLCVVESSLVSKANFHERIMKLPMSFQNHL